MMIYRTLEKTNLCILHTAFLAAFSDYQMS